MRRSLHDSRTKTTLHSQLSVLDSLCTLPENHSRTTPPTAPTPTPTLVSRAGSDDAPGRYRQHNQPYSYSAVGAGPLLPARQQLYHPICVPESSPVHRYEFIRSSMISLKARPKKPRDLAEVRKSDQNPFRVPYVPKQEKLLLIGIDTVFWERHAHLPFPDWYRHACPTVSNQATRNLRKQRTGISRFRRRHRGVWCVFNLDLRSRAFCILTCLKFIPQKLLCECATPQDPTNHNAADRPQSNLLSCRNLPHQRALSPTLHRSTIPSPTTCRLERTQSASAKPTSKPWRTCIVGISVIRGSR